jgi:hypothetical protein
VGTEGAGAPPPDPRRGLYGWMKQKRREPDRR